MEERNVNKTINIFFIMLHIMVSTIIITLNVANESNPESKSSQCSKSTVKIIAKKYANKKYGIGSSAAGCCFETGTVRKSGDTYSVTVYCGANNPIDFTYECTDGRLRLVSVNS